MSNIDLEKDELATQEMLAMLDDGIEETDESTSSATDQNTDDSLDMDDLLNSIEAVENETESEEVEDIQSSSDDALESVTEDANNDDLDALDELAEIDELAQSSLEMTNDETLSETEVDTLTETPTTASDEAEELMAAMQQAEPTSIESQEFDSELDEELHDNLLSEESADMAALNNIDDMDEIEDSQGSMETDNSESPQADDLNLELPEDLIAEQQTLENEIALEETVDTDFSEPEAMEMAESEPSLETVEENEIMELSETSETSEETVDEEVSEDISEEISDSIPDELDLTDALQTEPETEIEDSDVMDDALSVQETLETIETPTEELAQNDLPPVEETSLPAGNHYENTAEANAQLQSALDQMMEAIQMNEKMQQYAKQVEATTIKATQLALATAQKAQSQALQTQETIEASFAAAENAFETAQESGYQLDSQELEKFADTTSTEMEAFLSEIREKNRSLNETNQRLAERFASIQTQ